MTRGEIVIVAEADCVGSTRLVAVTVTVCSPESDAGVVYKPESSIEPTFAGLMDQTTDVFVAFWTFAVNCAVSPAP